MNKVHKQQDEGFTIIEVVLVLAIAALILLMVFLALPALQRGQRDTQGKNDVSRLQSSLNNYKSGARGQLPTSADLESTGASSYLAKYLRKGNDTFADPSGDNYRLVQITTNGTVPAWSEDITENIYFSKGGTCGDGQTPTAPNNEGSRRMNLVKPLEGGGVQCVEV